MPSFYHHELDLDSTDIVLSQEESQHAIKARRLRIGDAVSVINGRGSIAACQLEAIDKSTAMLKVLSIESKPAPSTSLTIASALPKGDRTRTMIDMLAQLGVNCFIPLRCDHSVQKCSPSVINKLQRYALEACKQSDNPWLMQIGAEQKIDELLGAKDRASVVYADGLGQPFSSVLGSTRLALATELCVAIGPEGGFSPNELALLANAQVAAIRLGSTILRTETAAVTAAAQWAV